MSYPRFADLRHLMHIALERARLAERDWLQGLTETRAKYPAESAVQAEQRWSQESVAKRLYATGMREIPKVTAYGLAAMVEAEAERREQAKSKDSPVEDARSYSSWTPGGM